MSFAVSSCLPILSSIAAKFILQESHKLFDDNNLPPSVKWMIAGDVSIEGYIPPMVVVTPKNVQRELQNMNVLCYLQFFSPPPILYHVLSSNQGQTLNCTVTDICYVYFFLSKGIRISHKH